MTMLNKDDYNETRISPHARIVEEFVDRANQIIRIFADVMMPTDADYLLGLKKRLEKYK